MFEVAIYTDTRADEAVDGIDGFNFQALSEGITSADRQVIKDHLLHRVVSGWSVERDPLDHPPSFACYRHADRFYVSRGISTGTTNNGRPGNILTQAIVTSDPEDFGSARPAQLLGAMNWRLEKAPRDVLDGWPVPVELDEAFQVESLVRIVTEDEWVSSHWPEILTMVEQVTAEVPKRLVITCSDNLLAQRWVALLSLFVDAETGRDLAIRGLVPDPMTVQSDIVVASPEFGSSLDPTITRSGVNVIDLQKSQVCPIQPSSSALIQSQWFLERDALEALGAIELARSWEKLLGCEVATQAAAIASFPDDGWTVEEAESALQALRILAEIGETDDLFFYGDGLVDAVIVHPLGSVERAAAVADAVVALAAADYSEIASGLLLTSLESMGASTGMANAWLATIAAAAPEHHLEWTDDEARKQAGLLMCGLSEDLDVRSLQDYFRSLLFANVSLSADDLHSPSERLAEHWSQNPQLTQECRSLPHADIIVACLARRLLSDWESGRAEALEHLLAGRWAWMANWEFTDAGLAAAICEWLRAAAVSLISVEQRPQAIRNGGTLPAASWKLVWREVAVSSSGSVVAAWVDSGHGVDAEAARWLVAQYQGVLRGRQPAVGARSLLASLEQSNSPITDPSLRQLISDVRSEVASLTSAAQDPSIPNPYLNTVPASLVHLAPLLVDLIGEVVARCPDRQGVSGLLEAIGKWSEPAVLSALTTRSNDRDMHQALTLALSLRTGYGTPSKRAATNFLSELITDSDRMKMVKSAEKSLDGTVSDELGTFLKEAKRGRLRRKISRAPIQILGGKDDLDDG